eukprot:Amastigsp_a510867_22.p3 type:complete len:145 gc:universal Amastigsp_a510867_22:869-1303(+)
MRLLWTPSILATPPRSTRSCARRISNCATRRPRWPRVISPFASTRGFSMPSCDSARRSQCSSRTKRPSAHTPVRGSTTQTTPTRSAATRPRSVSSRPRRGRTSTKFSGLRAQRQQQRLTKRTESWRSSGTRTSGSFPKRRPKQS